MNSILHLRGAFEQRARKAAFGYPSLPINASVNIKHLKNLRDDLLYLKEYWEKETLLSGALVSVCYNKVIAKSTRISETFACTGLSSNNSVVGAKFHNDGGDLKHIITHYIALDNLKKTIEKYEESLKILEESFNSEITSDDVIKLNSKKIFLPSFSSLSKNAFVKLVIDAFYVESFSIPAPDKMLEQESIITIYKTGVDAIELMKKIGISILPSKVIDETTILLNPDELSLLREKHSYLISMGVSDLSELVKSDFEKIPSSTISIPSPLNEPTIGVIDTMFDSNVYFSDWVEFNNMVDSNIPLSPEDYEHGTAVSSIIVDGPSLNPKMDDGCGRFKVRHFGVASGGIFSSFSILKSITEIISKNKDIKVWNLSLGSSLEIPTNFISAEAAILDEIQYKNDVIFIIAGTNKSFKDIDGMKIGSPADSINSLVVNSVDFNNKPASYSREGPVLSFFTKPDVSYYGGDGKDKITVYAPTGMSSVSGTSFAAPWIARKMSYLMDVMGLDKTTAKALLIDSATGWDKETISHHLIGNGVVPISIKDILETPEDQIKFIISGKSEKYDTYNYSLPVPKDKDKYPFIAKATMCYFPYCSRSQGVDYTNTELDICFGRIKYDGKIKPINENYQSSDGGHYTFEKTAREMFGKWDNVKHIRKLLKKKNMPLKVYDKKNWGISIKTKERLEKKHGEGLSFGLVITLKEINGQNRIEDFIQECFLNNWFVTRLDVQNKINLYNVAEEDVVFD